jgi:hypothetical protein
MGCGATLGTIWRGLMGTSYPVDRVRQNQDHVQNEGGTGPTKFQPCVMGE